MYFHSAVQSSNHNQSACEANKTKWKPTATSRERVSKTHRKTSTEGYSGCSLREFLSKASAGNRRITKSSQRKYNILAVRGKKIHSTIRGALTVHNKTVEGKLKWHASIMKTTISPIISVFFFLLRLPSRGWDTCERPQTWKGTEERRNEVRGRERRSNEVHSFGYLSFLLAVVRRSMVKQELHP